MTLSMTLSMTSWGHDPDICSGVAVAVAVAHLFLFFLLFLLLLSERTSGVSPVIFHSAPLLMEKGLSVYFKSVCWYPESHLIREQTEC